MYNRQKKIGFIPSEDERTERRRVWNVKKKIQSDSLWTEERVTGLQEKGEEVKIITAHSY